jgi:hypothetical protein
MEVLMTELDTEERQWKFISEMQGDIKVVFNRLDTIENNHLAHMQDDITKLDQKLWMILMVVFAQLFAIVGGLIVFMVS